MEGAAWTETSGGADTTTAPLPATTPVTLTGVGIKLPTAGELLVEALTDVGALEWTKEEEMTGVVDCLTSSLGF